MYEQSSPESIQALFASIAKDYDKGNTLCTLGIHKWWNQKLVHALRGTENLLDVCAGTGEIAFHFLKKNPKSRALLLDFCPQMLEIAEQKGKNYKGRFEILQGDAQALALPNCSVDGVSISYGIRNVKDPELCFKEVYRVLKEQGRFGILELTRPSSPFIRAGHKLYTKLAVPFLGKMITKNKEAYSYLNRSVENFSSPETLECSLQRAGFQHVRRTSLMGGIATLFLTSKE